MILWHIKSEINLMKSAAQITENAMKTAFENINPGDYSIRLIHDKNKNMKWDSGNYLKKIHDKLAGSKLLITVYT